MSGRKWIVAAALALAVALSGSTTARASTCNGVPAEIGPIAASVTGCGEARKLARQLIGYSLHACAHPWGRCRYAYWDDQRWITLSNGDQRMFRRRWAVRMWAITDRWSCPNVAYRVTANGGRKVRFHTEFDCA